MNNASFISTLNSLSPHLQADVLAYINKLLAKGKARRTPKTRAKLSRKAGFLKGTFRIKKGFDDPIEDFKEYME
jgi:hypothetical protein